MENTNVPVISAKDLNLWYGDFKALKGISLDVGEREITALIGPLTSPDVFGKLASFSKTSSIAFCNPCYHI